MKKIILDKRQFWLHIGMHRTATTSCQIAFKYIAGLGFSKDYFYYPKTGTNSVSNRYGHNDLVSGAQRKVNEDLFSDLRSELLSIPVEVPILLSAEEFWISNPCEILAQLGPGKVNLVYFEREFFSWVLSIWSLVALSEPIFTPYEFILGALEEIQYKNSIDEISFYDVDRVLNRWKTAINKRGRCYKIDFPKDLPHMEILNLVVRNQTPKEWMNIDIAVNASRSIADILSDINAIGPRELRLNAFSSSLLDQRILDIEHISNLKFPRQSQFLNDLISIN